MILWESQEQDQEIAQWSALLAHTQTAIFPRIGTRPHLHFGESKMPHFIVILMAYAVGSTRFY